jgi:hypothetical protein
MGSGKADGAAPYPLFRLSHPLEEKAQFMPARSIARARAIAKPNAPSLGKLPELFH